MRFTTALISGAVALAGVASAMPFPWSHDASDASPCIDNATAYGLVEAYLGLVTNFTDDVAEALLNSGFYLESDSINELTGGEVPLGSIVYPTKEIFISGYSQNPSLPLNILDLFFNCMSISYRWRSVELPSEVSGITIFEVSPSPNNTFGWGIDAEFIEFNSGSWLTDLGLYTPAAKKQ